MRYFHVPIQNISDNKVKITGRELRHLTNVLRLKAGDEIAILDGSGGIYQANLISCNRDEAIGEIKDSKNLKPSVEITLFVGLPKSDKMDLIIQKTTELGVYKIVPILCEYSVPRMSPERQNQRVARWRQIVIEASKQSHRPFFPIVSEILSFSEALKESKSPLKLLFAVNPIYRLFNLKDVLKKNDDVDKIDIFIGPEGDFTNHEIENFLSISAIPISLGEYILRTETAAIAAVSIVSYEKDALIPSPVMV